MLTLLLEAPLLRWIFTDSDFSGKYFEYFNIEKMTLFRFKVPFDLQCTPLTLPQSVEMILVLDMYCVCVCCVQMSFVFHSEL